MPSIHFRQGSVRWVLMETRVRLLGTGTIQQMPINQALMATRAINSSRPHAHFVLRGVLFLAFGFSSPSHSSMLMLCNALAFCPLSLSRTSGHPIVDFISPALFLAMPRERGKSRRGPTYYSQFDRHKRLGTSLSRSPPKW
jgi:hypothetical protein